MSKVKIGVMGAYRGKTMIDMQSDTAKKTSRIETELDLAKKIQTSMLPCLLPAFPDHENIELNAVYHPAKEVGGDFYDYFIIDKPHVGVVIADVSGKGVGAALFMTISKTVLKNQLQLGISPEEALTNANRQLCENNDAGLFVTCWAGVFDTETGVLSFVNAGGLYSSAASFAYSFAQRANMRFSAPASLIFWTPVIIE